MTQIPLQSRFKQDFTRIRYSEGSYVDGRYIDGVMAATSYKGSIQPFVDKGSETIQRLAEGDRTKKIIVIYTYPGTLRTVDEKNSYKADLVYYEGEVYEVQRVNRWSGQILTHDEVWGIECDSGVVIPGLNFNATVETNNKTQETSITTSLSLGASVSTDNASQVTDIVGSSGPISCAYPLDDDGTLSAAFGFGHAAANAPDYRRVDYIYQSPAVGGGAFALPNSANAFGSQAISIGSGKVAVEMLVNSVPDVDFNGVGISTVSSSGGIPSPGETSNAHIAVYSGSPVTAFSGLSASPIGVPLVGFRVGIVMDGSTGGITYITSEGTIGTATGRFTIGTDQTFVIQITDSGFVANGKTVSVTLITDAADMVLTYPAGTTDPCGNDLN